MTIEEVFNLVNNLDYKEKLRKFGPKWSTIAVNKNGIVVDVIRHKEQPTLESNKKHLLMHPETTQITAWPERFKDIAELQKVIDECKHAHENY